MHDPWSPLDPLGETLHFLRMDGLLYSQADFTAPWGLALPAMTGCLLFHVVTAGRCWLEIEGEKPHLLQSGDLALVPHGEGHQLVSEPGATATGLFDLPHEYLSERYEIVRHGGGGTPTSLICGAVRFDHPAAHHLIAHLPRLISVEAWHSSEREWWPGMLSLMAAEARQPRLGGEAVITRLADILVIQAIRAWLARHPAAQTGWLGALRDTQIGHSMARIHREPERPWSVASLAATVAMSRSAFAARFTTLVGEPPMHYVARWRMLVALTRLKEDGAVVSELAGQLGYQSEAAFSRAFKRFMGVSPGAVRRTPPAASDWLALPASRLSSRHT